MLIPHEVGEDEEVSIKEVADAIVKAMGFEGEYTVTHPHAWSFCAEADREPVVRYHSCRWTVQEASFEQETFKPHW